MSYQEGYVCHIKDEFFTKANRWSGSEKLSAGTATETKLDEKVVNNTNRKFTGVTIWIKTKQE